MAISRVMAIKRFFESEPNGRPITRTELVEMNKDREGYEWMANECAKALGETLENPTK